MSLYPYKAMIQLIANYATDVLNFLMQRSEALNIKNEIAIAKQERAIAKQERATAKQERATAKQERIDMNLRIDGNYEHLITIPDDYTFDIPVYRDNKIVAKIDIHKEFESATRNVSTHLHND